MPAQRARLVDVLAALSLTTDLAAGFPFERGLRACLVADGLAQALELDPRDHRAAFLAALLRANKEIASALVVSPRTVQNHLAAVYDKTRRTRAGAAVFAVEPRPDRQIGRMAHSRGRAGARRSRHGPHCPRT